MKFANWPSEPETPAPSSLGLTVGRLRNDLLLPRTVLEQIALVERTLSGSQAHAIWLSGSATRRCLRRQSDIDWVLVTDTNVHCSGWPTDRHSFQAYGSEVFLRSLRRGHEFSVWQIAYGYPLHLTPGFLEKLVNTSIAQNTIAIQQKLKMISRRKRLIQLLLECEAIAEVRKEILLLLQQQLRLEILRAGFVPGCRAELEGQLAVTSPARWRRWREEDRVWLQRLEARPARSAVLAAANHYLGTHEAHEPSGPTS